MARTCGGMTLSASIFNFCTAFHSAHMECSPLPVSLDDNADSRKLTACDKSGNKKNNRVKLIAY